MDVVFDMDGVIVDSAHAIRQAYLETGVTCPDDVLAHEGSGWFAEALDERTQYVKHRYDLKHQAYVRRLADDACTPLLPALATAAQLWDEAHRTVLLTSARWPAVDTLKGRLVLWPFDIAHDEMRTPDKMEFIRTTLADEGVYVDDQDQFIDLPDGWRFVRYSGQGADELYDQIIGE